jgi:tRNA A-37 threonylcarbamoyl transferase component Bud32
MRIKVKKYNETIRCDLTIGNYSVKPDALIIELKKLVSKDTALQQSRFHFEGIVLNTHVYLTDSFDFQFFFGCKSAIVYLKIHSNNLSGEEIFEQAVLAVKQGDEKQLLRLFGSSLEKLLTRKHSNGWSLLHYAAHCGHESLVKVLLEKGADVNEETEDGWTPLLLACSHGQIGCVSHLIRHKDVEINKITKRGSGLHLAVTYGHADAVCSLLKAKASCDLEDFNGKIPLELATDEEIIELIPKFQGSWELEKYTNNEKPPQFAGNLVVYSMLGLSYKQVFIFINLETGYIEEYGSKDKYMERDLPSTSFKILDIQKVYNHKANFFKSGHGFDILCKNGTKSYFTRHSELRDEWIKYINTAVLYCKVHKIGFDNSNQHEFTIIDQKSYETVQITEQSEDICLEMFERVAEIGSGSFGTVYKVIKKDTKWAFAMKCLSKMFLNKKKMLNYAISEVQIMKELNHPFVLCLYYSFQTSSSLYLVLEYCEKGDLESLLEKGKLSEHEAKFYIAEIVLGLEYLHKLGIIYRDLKPANILLDSEGHVRIADFGLAKTFDEKVESVSTVVGSPAYISPEIICHENLTKAADIYSLGIVMHELLTGTIPFPDLQMDKLFSSIGSGKFNFSDEIGKEAKDLIKKLVQRKPEKRPRIEEIKNHEFFCRIDWDLLAEKRYLSPCNF